MRGSGYIRIAIFYIIMLKNQLTICELPHIHEKDAKNSNNIKINK